MDKISSPAPASPAPPVLSAEGIDPAVYRLLLASRKAPHLSELTLGLLHKFNNLFTGVMFLTEDCATRADDGQPVGDRLREILGTLRTAHTFIDRLTQLHFDEAEEDAGYHELDAVIARQLDLVRLLLPRGAALTHTPAAERLTFYASERALSEILLHVAGNCGEALPKRGGALTITSRVDAAQPTHVAVEFRDNGPGFPAEILPHLFHQLGTTKNAARHPGLGLVRCRELARAFGGDLTAENHAEGGAVVTLTLPQDNSSTR